MKRFFWNPSRDSATCHAIASTWRRGQEARDEARTDTGDGSTRSRGSYGRADFLLDKLDALHILSPLIDQQAVLWTNGASVYSAFARCYGITYPVVQARSEQRIHAGAFHIQNITADLAIGRVTHQHIDQPK